MSADFLRAVANTILPAETAPPAGANRIPGGSEAGIDLAHYPQSGPVLDALRQSSGGEAGFLAASPDQRRAALEAIERARPTEFQALLAALLPDYYETAAVLRAFGWRVEPPQPQGHVLPAGDLAAAGLERVERRSALWRRPAGRGEER